jgi:hypothetical protein
VISHLHPPPIAFHIVALLAAALLVRRHGGSQSGAVS